MALEEGPPSVGLLCWGSVREYLRVRLTYEVQAA